MGSFRLILVTHEFDVDVGLQELHLGSMLLRSRTSFKGIHTVYPNR